jgi:hypothetical protein
MTSITDNVQNYFQKYFLNGERTLAPEPKSTFPATHRQQTRAHPVLVTMPINGLTGISATGFIWNWHRLISEMVSKNIRGPAEHERTIEWGYAVEMGSSATLR